MIFGKMKLYLIAALGFIAALGMAVLKGQSMQKAKRLRKDHIDYVKTRENIEEAQLDASIDDPADWLRDRADKRDLR